VVHGHGNFHTFFRVFFLLHAYTSSECAESELTKCPQASSNAWGTLERDALASILTFWCRASQCEVATGIWLDADGLQRLARQGRSLRCGACGQQHPVKEAYLKPHPPQGRIKED
jgi:hypothetical protein